MGLSRKKIEAMKEVELQSEILVPMFEAMGFRDVRLNHGTNERGKDIIMWKRVDDVQIERYVVVAKARKITGKASGTGSAQELFFQIDQALQNTYPDPSTNSTVKADRCIVANSHSISPQAHNAIEGSMQNRGYDQITTFIDGAEFWRHVKKYLIRETIMAKSAELTEALEKYDDKVSATISKIGKQNYIGFSSKSGEPIKFEIGATIEVPLGEQGDEFLSQWKEHVERGTAIEIPMEYIAKLEGPSYMEPFLDKEELKSLLISPAVGQGRKMHLSLSITNPNGESHTLSRIPFLSHGGTKEMIFESCEELRPIKIRMPFLGHPGPITVHFELKTELCWVIYALEALDFADALAEGGVLTVTWDESEGELSRGEVSAGAFPKTPNEFRKVLERLRDIQLKLLAIVHFLFRWGN